MTSNRSARLFCIWLLLSLCAAPTLRAQPAADSADVESIDAIVTALYDVISGPADEEREWDRFRSLFHPEGRLIPMRPQQADGSWAPVVLTPDAFARRNAELMRTHPAFQGKGFYETEAARRTERFGAIATVWSTYEGRFAPGDEDPFLRGINTLDLVYDGRRWWVLQILWQEETPQFSLPAEYLTSEQSAQDAAAQKGGGPTIALVLRHAETEASASNDPALSEEGRQRARSLIETVGAAEVAAVYASQFKRTRATAEPLAKEHGVPVTVREVSAATIDRYAAALAEAIRSEHAGEVVAVVSHSNVVPQIVEALGGEAGSPIPEDEYDRLYVVVIPPEGAVRTISAAY